MNQPANPTELIEHPRQAEDVAERQRAVNLEKSGLVQPEGLTIARPAPQQNLAPIIGAVHAVMSAVAYIQKTGNNAHQHYAYASEADVLAAIRPAMVEQGLVLFPNVVRMEHESYSTKNGGQGTRVFVTVEHTLAHVSGAVWPEKIKAVGCAEDTQDKAVAQAGTSAQKYCLLRLFLVETGQDSDKGSPVYAHAPAKGQHRPPQSTLSSPEASNAPRPDPPPPPPQQTQQGGSQGARAEKEKCTNCQQNAVIPSKYGGKWCTNCKAKYPEAGPPPPPGPHRPSGMAQSLIDSLTEVLKNSGGPASEILEDFKNDNRVDLHKLNSDDGIWFEEQADLLGEGHDVPF